MQVGVQFHLPTYKDHPIPELVSLGKTAKAAGISQLWVTDNLQSRNAFVVVAAMASNIPINLGTAVTVPILPESGGPSRLRGLHQ